MKEKLIELVDDILGYLPWGEITSHTAQDIADHLIANGVTIQPAAPGPTMGHDMAERCYHNGEEAMREKVIDYLRDQKGLALGVVRITIGDIIEKVKKL